MSGTEFVRKKKSISTLTGYKLCGHEINFRVYVVGDGKNRPICVFCLN